MLENPICQEILIDCICTQSDPTIGNRMTFKFCNPCDVDQGWNVNISRTPFSSPGQDIGCAGNEPAALGGFRP